MTLQIITKSSMATEVSENKILQCFLKDIEESIPINFNEQKIRAGKVFEKNFSIIREIENHKKESGENGATIEKTNE